MENINYSGKHHSILPHSVFIHIVIVTFFALLKPTHAMATCYVARAACLGTAIECKSANTTYCCGTSAECTTLQAKADTKSVTGSKPVECDGGKGISTGLGCIPVQTDGLTAALLTFLSGTSGAIALVVMLVATIQIMTAGGNGEQLKKGKELFTAAVTGLLFIIFSVVLMRIVASDVLKIPGFEQSQDRYDKMN